MKFYCNRLQHKPGDETQSQVKTRSGNLCHHC
ncbi:unnamed protein product, partial [Rotaria sp. Silwood2]